MWLMLQQSKPDDYVLATGESRSVGELCQTAYGMMGLDWEEFVEVDKSLYRPTEVEHLRGDPSKAQSIGWRRKWSFQHMIGDMVAAASE
jgi:GDPmannose 4,6-dehydratase